MENVNRTAFKNGYPVNQSHKANGSAEQANGESARSKDVEGTLLILDDRILTRECLADSMKAHDIDLEIAACGSLDEWKQVAENFAGLSALLLISGSEMITEERAEELRDLVTKFHPVPVLLLADSDNLEQIVLALECGVKGYIPSSVGVAVCVQAIRMALVGGHFVPSSSVMAMRNYIKRKAQTARPMSSMFTQRQAEVVQALRKGKANKIIAYELNMRESTVKVHIRNIMKKLKATNRTEVAYKINDLFPEDSRRAVQ